VFFPDDGAGGGLRTLVREKGILKRKPFHVLSFCFGLLTDAEGLKEGALFFNDQATTISK
jgi:hypothetical protein